MEFKRSASPVGGQGQGGSELVCEKVKSIMKSPSEVSPCIFADGDFLTFFGLAQHSYRASFN